VINDQEQKNHDQSHSSEVDYERSDAKPLLLGISFAVGLILLAFALIGVNDLFIAVKEKMIYEAALKPESFLLKDVRSREEAILNSYAVVDSAKGAYRIPIDRAMKLMAEDAYVSSGR